MVFENLWKEKYNIFEYWLVANRIIKKEALWTYSLFNQASISWKYQNK